MFNAPFSQIIKLKIEIKWLVLSNDVPMLESIPTHYASLGFLKFPKIIKLNVRIICLLFHNYFHNGCLRRLLDLLLGINA